jgi:hypothetical protein
MSRLTQLASDGTAHFNAAGPVRRRWLVFTLGLIIGAIIGAWLF